MSEELKFRKAVPDDQHKIVKFQLEMAMESENLRLDFETCTQGVSEVFGNPNRGTYYVAEQQEGRDLNLLASLLIIPEWSDWRNGEVWWIHSVYVVPSARRKGVYSKFYAFIQSEGRSSQKMRGLRLYVDKRNIAAQTTYEKLGMTNNHYDLYEWMRSDMSDNDVKSAEIKNESSEQGLQEKYAPKSSCFGCGPANEKGLKIRSIVRKDQVVAEWQPSPHHEAFPGVLNGGIIGALLDCHSNWTAAWHLMNKRGDTRPPCTVTADYSIKLLKPTPTNGPLQLAATVVSDDGKNRATIDATLSCNGIICATCRGTFVVVKPGHPAYHRW